MVKRIIELSIDVHNHTKFRVYFNKEVSMYIVEYRNDIEGVKSPNNTLVKGGWVYLDSQYHYSYALDSAFDFAKDHDASQPEE